MPRKRYSAFFKVKITLAALKGDKDIAEISSIFKILPNQISKWKRQCVEGASEVFSRSSFRDRESELQRELDESHRQLGQTWIELGWL